MRKKWEEKVEFYDQSNNKNKIDFFFTHFLSLFFIFISFLSYHFLQLNMNWV